MLYDVTMYGYVFDRKTGEKKGYKDELSYSGITLWQKSKLEYRARYYEGKSAPHTPYTLFGSKIHTLIENHDKSVQHVLRYDRPEFEARCEIDGVKIMGVIDTFDSNRFRFADYKTGIRSRDGKPRWTRAAVEKLDQLPFYSLMIRTKFGRTNPWTDLVWLETAWKNTKGRGIGSLQELTLTGHTETFHRRIAEWERQRMRTIILKCAKEIAKDFQTYEKQNQ